MEIKIFIVKFITILGDLISYAIFARIILSWFTVGRPMQSPSRVQDFLKDVTDPVLNLAKKLPHRIGMIDLSPVIALLAINFLVYGLVQLVVYI